MIIYKSSWHTRVYPTWYCAKPGVCVLPRKNRENLRIWTDAGTFNELSKFLVTNTVITDPILRLSKYYFPLCWVNLKDCIFLKKINQLLVVFYFTLLHFFFFFFFELFPRQTFSGLYKLNFSLLPKYAGLIERKFLKTFLQVLHIRGAASFLKFGKFKFSKFLLLPLSNVSGRK